MSIFSALLTLHQQPVFTFCLSDFESLIRSFEKAKKVINEEGIPKFYIKTIAELETYVNDVWEDKTARKQMSKISAKSLTTLRQKVRKYNKDFEVEIKDFVEVRILN